MVTPHYPVIASVMVRLVDLAVRLLRIDDLAGFRCRLHHHHQTAVGQDGHIARTVALHRIDAAVRVRRIGRTHVDL